MDQVDASFSKMAGKTGVGAAVRASQLSASRRLIEKLLKSIFKDVEKVIREEQSNAARLAESLLIKDEAEIWEMILPDVQERADTLENLRVEASRQIQAVMKRVFQTEKPLSAKIYRTEALAKNQVTRVVDRHIAIGSSAQDMAKDVRSLIRPDVAGGVSYRAKLLARTEINNAFHAQSIDDAKGRPWLSQMYWNLSKSHNEQGCICEEYARQHTFHIDEVPEKPHPQCLCSVTPKLPDLDTALKEFMTGQYSPWLP